MCIKCDTCLSQPYEIYTILGIAMRKKTIIQIDASTGEELRGTLVWVEDKPKSMGQFVKAYQVRHEVL